ncbi:MAG: hypothetical protein AAGC77_06055 [Pseudomonadota bacterium]
MTAEAMVNTSSAQSLKESRARAEETQAIQDQAQYTAHVCGNNLRARIDWSSLDTWPDGLSISDACDGALSALEAMCRGDGKDDAQSIAQFVCAGDGGGASLSAGTLRYGASPDGDAFSATKALLDSTF